MSQFREFYIPVGAGSNFIAINCLWAKDIRVETNQSSLWFDEKRIKGDSVNEFFIERQKITDGDKVYNTIPRWLDHKIDNKDLIIQETKRIMPILKKLDLRIDRMKTTHPDVWFSEFNSKLRKEIIEKTLDDFWQLPNTYKHQAFLCQFEDHKISKKLIGLVQNYFAKCREYYFKVCDDNNWNSYIISHQHPLRLMPNLVFPSNFKSLAMKTDKETLLFINALALIKGNRMDEIEILSSPKFKNTRIDKNVKFSNDTVSYRKIFFESNKLEIRKMYEFFRNEEHFDENEIEIMKEFKKYHINNVKLIKQANLLPIIYG